MSDFTPTYVLDSVVTNLAGVNGIVSITVKATKGNFTVSVEGDVTGNVKYNATNEELQTALESLGAVDIGDIVVTGGPGDSTGTKPYLLTFGGRFAGAKEPVITTSVTGLEEGTKTAAVAVVQAGTAGSALATQKGTGLADRTGEAAQLAGESPKARRAAHGSEFGD